MKAVASMVTAGYTLCDVGTDHGYVPIALVQGNIIPKAIAVDINKGPLASANGRRASGMPSCRALSTQALTMGMACG